MYLIINKVVQLEVVHIADCYLVIELFACSSVIDGELAVLSHAQCVGIDEVLHFMNGELVIFMLEVILLCHFKALADISLVRAVKYRGHYLPAQCLCSHTEMHLKHLTDVHTRRYAQRVKADIKRSTVLEERHILLRKYS